MATAKIVQRITAWSFSRLQDYRKCPYLAKLKHVDKLKEPGNDAMARGSRIGKEAEDFIKGTLKKATPEIASFKDEFLELRKRKAVTEEQWTFTSKWTETGWFDSDAWCRIKTDIYSFDYKSLALLVVDNKTGKINPAHDEQLKLYALGGLLKFPAAETVDTRLWYLDHGVEIPAEPVIYTRSQLPELKKYWEKETKPMLSDTRFAPKPSNNCRWCHFSKAKNGPCKF